MRLLKFHFEDKGQDLLWFIVDLDTEMVAHAGPFHHSIYGGMYVFCPSQIQTGEYLSYSENPITQLNQPLTTIKYKITQIEPVKHRRGRIFEAGV